MESLQQESAAAGFVQPLLKGTRASIEVAKAARNSKSSSMKNFSAEMTGWIAVSSLLILALGICFEADRFLMLKQFQPSSLQRNETALLEFQSAEIFDVLSMLVSISWMIGVLGLHFRSQWSSKEKEQRKPHIGAYLIYGLFFFVLGGTFRNIFRLLLFFNNETYNSGRVYLLVTIFYIILQAFFIHCNRRQTLFKRHLLNGIIIFHTVVTNAILYLRVFFESKLDILSPNGSGDAHKSDEDKYTNDIVNMYKNSSIFLNPFMLEFALTAIAMLAELWLEGHEQEPIALSQHELAQVSSTQYRTMKLKSKSQSEGESELSTPEKIKKAAGAVVVALIVFCSFIFMVILFHFLDKESNPSMVFHIFKLTVIVIMTGICIVGHVILHGNPAQKGNGPGLDEVLLYVAIMGSLCIAILHIISSISMINKTEYHDSACLLLVESILSIIQAIVQSTLISKALHRDPRNLAGWLKVFSPCHLAIVLAAFNLGMWLLATITLESIGEDSIYNQYLSENYRKIDKQFYGKQTWLWVRLLLFPVIVFFRIHSFFTLFRIFDIHSHIALKT